jgi:hypothetical protein
MSKLGVFWWHCRQVFRRRRGQRQSQFDDACKRGFLAGCRPLICIDVCHIKTRYKGEFLTAVGIDPNDCIFHIAFGLAKVECTSSWEWFLTNLKEDLNITNTSPWTVMSDKQKVIVQMDI